MSVAHKEQKTINCPIELTLIIIGDKWKVLILRELFSQTRRFNELMRRLVPISQKMLTQQLRALEDHGIIHRTVYPQVPPKVEYSLTELGQSLAPVLQALGKWGCQHKHLFEEKYPIDIQAQVLTRYSGGCEVCSAGN